MTLGSVIALTAEGSEKVGDKVAPIGDALLFALFTISAKFSFVTLITAIVILPFCLFYCVLIIHNYSPAVCDFVAFFALQMSCVMVPIGQ